MFFGRRELLVLAASLSFGCNKPAPSADSKGGSAPAPVPSQAAPIALNGAGCNQVSHNRWIKSF